MPHLQSLNLKPVPMFRHAFLAVLVFLTAVGDLGLPLWVSHHTNGPLWVWAIVVGISAGGTVLFQNRVSRLGATVPAAARLGLWSGVALAASCMVYATSYHSAGAVAVLVIIAATTVFLVGELLFVSSGFGLSVGLTPEDLETSVFLAAALAFHQIGSATADWVVWLTLADQGVFATTTAKAGVLMSIPTHYVIGLLLIAAIRVSSRSAVVGVPALARG